MMGLGATVEVHLDDGSSDLYHREVAAIVASAVTSGGAMAMKNKIEQGQGADYHRAMAIRVLGLCLIVDRSHRYHRRSCPGR